MLSFKHIHNLALKVGFSLVGVARSRSLSEHATPLNNWLSQGNASGLHYMSRNIDKRLNPSKLFPGAKSVIVCATNYKNLAWKQNIASTPYRISSYAYSRDYHLTLKEMLFKVADGIKEQNPEVRGRCFVDTAPILEKAWAVEAGLGWIGKNSLLITPQYGSFLFLGIIVIDAEVDHYSTPFDKERCGSCTKCIDSCPNGAINSNRTIDTRLCISRLTVERLPEGAKFSKSFGVAEKNEMLGENEGSEAPEGSEIPGGSEMPGGSEASEKIRLTPSMLNGWLFGCDQCQSCCPYNQQTPLYTLPQLAPVIEPKLTTATFWEQLSREQFDTLFAQTPMERGGYDTLRERIDFIKKG